MNTQARLSLNLVQLETWVEAAKSRSDQGSLPTYIPQLAMVSPKAFAVQVLDCQGNCYLLGNADLRFSLMSVVKPFLLLYMLVELGADRIFAQVGMEPSDYPFNSLEQLQADGGWPRNPMINSGAIALSALLPGPDGQTRCQVLSDWLNHWGGCSLQLDYDTLNSVRSAPNSRNHAITTELYHRGTISDAIAAIDAYNHICCLSATVEDLAKLGMLLLQPPQPTWIEPCRQVKALMMTCGLYEASSRFAVQVGVPTKSGVSGVVLSVIPGWGAIACYSPPLDDTGNSVAGLFLIQEIVRSLNLSIFN
ncbi:MAG: glutaminase [Arthrospira sp. SH-MAG29]|nr:glutaminase [Arthrospira sp. SH-MAG29]MBS0015782.1 glutaminase [Arthrospira sp. SH-MAG29]